MSAVNITMVQTTVSVPKSLFDLLLPFIEAEVHNDLMARRKLFNESRLSRNAAQTMPFKVWSNSQLGLAVHHSLYEAGHLPNTVNYHNAKQAAYDQYKAEQRGAGRRKPGPKSKLPPQPMPLNEATARVLAQYLHTIRLPKQAPALAEVINCIERKAG